MERNTTDFSSLDSTMRARLIAEALFQPNPIEILLEDAAYFRKQAQKYSDVGETEMAIKFTTMAITASNAASLHGE